MTMFVRFNLRRFYDLCDRTLYSSNIYFLYGLITLKILPVDLQLDFTSRPLLESNIEICLYLNFNLVPCWKFFFSFDFHVRTNMLRS
jgi:hypothetical protein